MPLDFSSGLVVTVTPPTIPVVRAAPPSSGVMVVPLIGPQGPEGPEGSTGGGGFRHNQTTPATVWTITHNFGRYPTAVSLYSGNLSENYTEFIVQHLSDDELRVSMEIPTAGVALLI